MLAFAQLLPDVKIRWRFVAETTASFACSQRQQAAGARTRNRLTVLSPHSVFFTRESSLCLEHASVSPFDGTILLVVCLARNDLVVAGMLAG